VAHDALKAAYEKQHEKSIVDVGMAMPRQAEQPTRAGQLQTLEAPV